VASSSIWFLATQKINMNLLFPTNQLNLRMHYRFVSILVFYLGAVSCADREILLQLPEGNSFQSNTLVQVKLTEKLRNQPLRLMGKNSRGRFEVSYQIQEETLYWLSDTESTVYSLLVEAPSVHPEIKLSEREGQIEVYQNQTKIVGYQVAVKNPPKGINPAFKRSGYLHPVNTTKGKRLTQIQPKDHFHHYGIWNPWTHTLFEGDTLDFWNLAKEEGTVRFAKLLKKESGAVFSEFKVLQEHVVLKNGAEKVALNETQHIKVIPINQNQYLMDFTIQYECATEQPFTILKYRYAGFGWRTTEEWDNQNSRVLSSEGKTRKTADGSTARWYIVDGKLGQEYGGALMLSHPENYNHPEPLRVWPEDMYGRGDLFVNFATTKTTDWTLNPGKVYTLKYQLLIYDGTIQPDVAEKKWNQFAYPLGYKINP
jgi:hypothetical protein